MLDGKRFPTRGRLMAGQTLGVIMNGITGRMGYRQHLVRSVLAIREQGGVTISDGSRVQVEPILVGRRDAAVREIAERHGIERWTTDLDKALADPSSQVYFDAQLTSARAAAAAAAIRAGKHVYTEKPVTATRS